MDALALDLDPEFNFKVLGFGSRVNRLFLGRTLTLTQAQILTLTSLGNLSQPNV